MLIRNIIYFGFLILYKVFKSNDQNKFTQRVIEIDGNSLDKNFINSQINTIKNNDYDKSFACNDDIKQGKKHGKWIFKGVTSKVYSIECNYIDGVLKDTTSGLETFAGSPTEGNIGSNTEGGNYFEGLIDEVSIYNTELSASKRLRLT